MVAYSPPVTLPLEGMLSLVWCLFAGASGDAASVPAALQASNIFLGQVVITCVTYFIDLNEFKSLWQFSLSEPVISRKLQHRQVGENTI